MMYSVVIFARTVELEPSFLSSVYNDFNPLYPMGLWRGQYGVFVL